MHFNVKNIVGNRYGRLKVLEYFGGESDHPHKWKCKCDCGAITYVNGYIMKRGDTLSCGCLRRDKLITHGQTKHPIYKTWKGMIQRCYDPSDARFKYYGARGITVCDEWKHNPAKFFADMGPKPKGASIDRIDNTKGYSRANCRWTDITTQNRNRRGCIFLTLNGETRGLPEWSIIKGVKHDTLFARYKRGWSVEKILNTKV